MKYWDQSVLVVAKGRGKGRMRSDCLMGTGFPRGVMKRFETRWRWRLYYTVNVLSDPHTLKWRDFPGSPVVKTSPSNAGGAGSIPGGEDKVPNASRPKKPEYKTEAISYVTNSITTLKEMVHIKKAFLKGGEFYVMWILPQSKQAGSRVGQPVVSGDPGLPILPLTQTGSFQPRSFPQSHHHLVVLVPCSPFLCVCGRAGVRRLSHILNPPFLRVCSSEFGRNSCPRYQLLLPEVCEYLWLLICFLFTMSAALLAFVLIIKTQFIIKTSILWWNWVLRIL